jgi:hypothetical protein
VVLVRRVHVLPGLDFSDFPLDRDQPRWAGREVVFDEGVEPAQVVAGDGGVHVMLGVVILKPKMEFYRR